MSDKKSADNTLRFVKVDYESHRDALIQRVRSRWPGVWNDFSSNNVAMMLVDLMAWTTQTWAFTVNGLANESFIPTMQLRESAQRVGGLVNYKLRGPVPASLLCEAWISSPAPGASGEAYMKIEKGTAIRVGAKQLPFEVAEDYTIYGGQTTPITSVVTFDARESGARVLSTNVRVQNGLNYVDLVDQTVNAGEYVSVGQSVRRTQPSADSSFYTVSSLEAVSTPGIYNRIYLSENWSSSPTSSPELISVEVVDRRIRFVQGQQISEQFVTPPSEVKNYIVKLSRYPVIGGSVKVYVNDVPWEEVSSLVVNHKDGLIYEVSTLPSGETTVRFGDGQFGTVVPTDATVMVEYRVGGGVSGNVPLNSVNTSITGFVISLQNPVTVYIKNESSSGQGGRDAQTLEEARAEIPHYISANDRAITLDDWQTTAQAFSDPTYGSVAYARASVNVENAFLEGNIVYVYAWTTGPGGSLIPLSDAMKSALSAFLKTKAVGTDFPVVVNGSERPVPISLRFKTFAGYSVIDTTSLVNSTVDAIVKSLRPGSPLVYSDFVRALDEVSGVDSVTMATPISDLVPSGPSELFTTPREDFRYAISRLFMTTGTAVVNGSQVPVNRYSIQLPVWPLAVWSFTLYLGGYELTVVQDTSPGYARILGDNVVDDDNGNFKSRVNLLTGKGEIVLVGSPGDLAMGLVPVQGYDRERTVDIYVGYNGINTTEKRAEIRAALASWGDGLSIGGAIFARPISGLSVSKTSIQDVVLSIPGVTAVNRVALDNPASVEDRVNAASFELLKIGSIILNNKIV